MRDLRNDINMEEKLESFLVRACEAEEKDDYAEAERLFRLALYCEGRLRPDVTDAKEYANQAGPLYPETRLASSQLDGQLTTAVA